MWSANWEISRLFARQEYDDCLLVIERALEASGGLCEYAAQVKGLIKRTQGNHEEALELFQAATCLNPLNPSNIKQVAYSLLLQDKYKAALETFQQAIQVSEACDDKDWKIWHNSGVCCVKLEDDDGGLKYFQEANTIGQPREATFVEIARIYKGQQKHKDALRVYQDALDYAPESPDLLCAIGLCYLRLQDHQRAFEYLGNALTHDPRHFDAILAAGSIIQDNGDFDVALHKYRVAAVQEPESPELWNNIGLALFGKKKLQAAVSCLEKANDEAPMEWIIAYNLALVYWHHNLIFRAFHYFQATSRFNDAFIPAFLYMAVCQAGLEDPIKAKKHFLLTLEKLHGSKDLSLQLSAHLNYGIFLYNEGDLDGATAQSSALEALLQQSTKDDDIESNVLEQIALLESRLKAAKRRNRDTDPPASSTPPTQEDPSSSFAAAGGEEKGVPPGEEKGEISSEDDDEEKGT